MLCTKVIKSQTQSLTCVRELLTCAHNFLKVTKYLTFAHKLIANLHTQVCNSCKSVIRVRRLVRLLDLSAEVDMFILYAHVSDSCKLVIRTGKVVNRVHIFC